MGDRFYTVDSLHLERVQGTFHLHLEMAGLAAGDPVVPA
jgi:hypothetical protein